MTIGDKTLPTDTYFVGTGGLVFGSMYADAEIIAPTGDANPHEAKEAGGDGWVAGDLNKVTFPTGGTEHYLTVPVPGVYEVFWSMALHIAAGAGSEIHAGIMVDDVAIVTGNGEDHRSVANLNDSGSIGSPGTVDCPNGTEEISLWVSNDNSNDVHIEHATLFIKQIGGT